MDVQPVWMGDTIYFLSDRDWATNVWSYDVRSGALAQLTRFRDADVKTLAGRGGALAFEQDGALWTMTPGQAPRRLTVTVRGDFPVGRAPLGGRDPEHRRLGHRAQRPARAVRGPRRHLQRARREGDARNLTRSPGAADRAPVWSPDGRRVAWFSDEGAGYRLMIADADGLGTPRALPIGDARMAWNPAWSPDGAQLAFVDDKARLRVMQLATGRLRRSWTPAAPRATAGPWSRPGAPTRAGWPYAKTFANQFSRVVVWSAADGRRTLTDALASATNPVWDRNGRWLYFLASTDLGLQSGWADLGSLTRTSTSGVYAALLRADEPTPFLPESDEEAAARVIGAPPGVRPAPVWGRGAGNARRAPAGRRAKRRPPAPARTGRRRGRRDLVPRRHARAGRAHRLERIDRASSRAPCRPRDYAGLVPGPRARCSWPAGTNRPAHAAQVRHGQAQERGVRDGVSRGRPRGTGAS
jgi:tricorn protease